MKILLVINKIIDDIKISKNKGFGGDDFEGESECCFSTGGGGGGYNIFLICWINFLSSGNLECFISSITIFILCLLFGMV